MSARSQKLSATPARKAGHGDAFFLPAAIPASTASLAASFEASGAAWREIDPGRGRGAGMVHI